MQWHCRIEELDYGTLRLHAVTTSDRIMSLDEVFSAWRESEPFRATWLSWLRTVRFRAFCWECPPACHTTGSAPFECVFVSSPSLSRMGTDANAFAGHFRAGCDIATFWNLGGDALLVAPCPEETGDFAHLASFTATASPKRQDALWRTVGDALLRRAGAQPLWVSTAGHGVAWLHVRLDSRPKYYRHAPYTRI